MRTIHCARCSTRKLETEFYRSKSNTSGRMGQCKSCVISRTREYRAENIERVREYDRARGLSEERKASVRGRQWKYTNTPSRREWRKRNPEKWSAHIKLNNAIRDGNIIKPDACTKCGGRYLIHGHHEDYSKPLDVIWLCHWCHLEVHRAKREKLRTERCGALNAHVCDEPETEDETNE